MKVLLVEDDECIAETLEKALGNQHYVVDIATDGQNGWELVEAFTYDLILLDVILPKLDGISFCQRLRSHNYQTPVLLITAQNSSTDKVMGLDAGADDYVVKPFEVQELLARMRVLLRRNSSGTQPHLEWGHLRLDPSMCEVTYSGSALHLTPKEYRLLELFLRNTHCVFSRDEILDRLWSVEEAPGVDTVTAHIKGLRQKLKQAGAASDFIETVYGLGYRLKQSLPIKQSPSLPQPENQDQQQVSAALAQVWEKFKGQSSDRLAVLEQAATAALEQDLGKELRLYAIATAHKLAGSVGIFGFAEGSRLAFEIEQMFQSADLERNEALHLHASVMALRRELQKFSRRQLDKSLGNNSQDSRGRLVPYQGCPVLLVVDDAFLAQQIARLAIASGIQIEIVQNLFAVGDAIALNKVDVVLLDFSCTQITQDKLSFLAEITNQTPPIPVLFFTDDNSLTNRVELSQLAAHVILQKPLLPEQLLEALTRVLKSRSHKAKVLVVDDDPQLLAHMQALLEPWRLSLTTLDDPQQFWDVVEELSPELLILDVQMPGFSGVELCKVVRNAPKYHQMPILFLTAHTDEETVRQVFTAGADNCLNKFGGRTELVTDILNRLEQVRLLQSTNNMANSNAAK